MIQKPIIAIDIDDVLAQFAPAYCRFARDSWNADVTTENFTEDWSKILKTDDIKIIKQRAAETFGNLDLYDGLKVITGAQKILPSLAEKFTLVPLTSRIAAQKDLTMNWLNRNFGDVFDEVIFSGAYETDKDFSVTVHLTKGDVCSQIGASYLIDDQPKHVNGATECGVKALLFGDYGWNRDAEIVDGVTRVADWGGVADYFGV